MATQRELLDLSTQDPQAFWSLQARRIDWHTECTRVLDETNAPFSRWFVGGKTNLCHNALDRHLSARGDQAALIAVSTETGAERVYSYRELHREVVAMAAIFRSLGVGTGDRVLIYLPMIAEATFAMLACARIGAIHSVVFGGFAATSLASRIDDARPTLVVCADAGFENTRAVSYKRLMDQALEQATAKPRALLMIDRGIAPAPWLVSRDHDYALLRERYLDAHEPCVWLDSNAPSYILYTSGTTGQAKGVLRDTGGYAVALATSMDYLFSARAGDTMFTTSDLGWVVGHSYGVYGPLLIGMSILMVEGMPTRPDAGIWWRLVERYRVNLMLSAPTAMRLLKRRVASALGTTFGAADLSSLRALFLAGEPLDEPTSAWLQQALRKPVIDHYWQTESGWPMLALPFSGEQANDELPKKAGSPGVPSFGFKLSVVDNETGAPCEPGRKGILVAQAPLPPGCLITLWEKDQECLDIYWQARGAQWIYSTFDWCVADHDGYLRMLGRSDDVINVAGKRLGTREIEEILLRNEAVSEAAVVGVPDSLRGQVPIAFVVLRRNRDAELPRGMDTDTDTDLWQDVDAAPDTAPSLEAKLIESVGAALGRLSRPKKIISVAALPRTRSGKVLRRLIRESIATRDCSLGSLAQVSTLRELIEDLVAS
jgi:propionyl-CoA synthetase